MSHTRISIGVAENGSVQTASRSGFRIMSDSLIAFQPAIEEPSNMKPSVSSSSPTTPATIVRCCHLPLGSVNRRSTHSISWSLIILRTSFAEFAICPIPFRYRLSARQNRESCCHPDARVVTICCAASNSVFIPLAGADAQSRLHRNHEDLAVANAAGLRGSGDRLHHTVGQGVLDDHLELHLGKEIDDIFRAAIQLGMSL